MKESRNHELRGDSKINDADRTARAIDLSVLISLEEAQVDGEPDLIVELIDLYLDEAPRRMAAMATLLAQRDWLSLSRAAHSLKGCSAVLGAGRTPQLCDAVEQFAVDDAHPVNLEVLHKLHEEFALVRKAFLHEKQRRTSIRKNPQSYKLTGAANSFITHYSSRITDFTRSPLAPTTCHPSRVRTLEASAQVVLFPEPAVC